MTHVERACKNVTGFGKLYQKLIRHVGLTGKRVSALNNYTCGLATMALHFNFNPLELDEEQVLDYLQHLKTAGKTPSSNYFKHKVYGLSFAYKATGFEPKGISLPSLKFLKKLPVVLSQQEVKRSLKASTEKTTQGNFSSFPRQVFNE